MQKVLSTIPIYLQKVSEYNTNKPSTTKYESVHRILTFAILYYCNYMCGAVLVNPPLHKATYTLCIIPHLCLGPENKSLQNEADRSIFNSKFVFVLVTKSTEQKPKRQ